LNNQSLAIIEQFTAALRAINPLNPFLTSLREKVGPNAVITVRYDSDPRLLCLSGSQSTLGAMPPNTHLAVVANYLPPDVSHLDRTPTLLDVTTACDDKNQLRSIEPVYNAEMLVNDGGTWKTALSTVEGLDGVWISKRLTTDTPSRYNLNGRPLGELLSRQADADNTEGYLFGSGAIGAYRLEVIANHDGCRADITGRHVYMDLVLGQPSFPELPRISNGITVGAPKVYDTLTLRQMLNTTAQQLASISGFSQSQIFSQLGTFQGITRDTSFIAAQATAMPTPTISTVTSAGLSGASTASTNAVLNVGGSASITTMQCPQGTVPSINTGAVQSCTAPILNSSVSATPTILGAGALGGNSAQENNLATSGSLQATTNNGLTQNTSQQGQTTINSGGYAPTIPTAPISSAFTPPTNVGVSASDSLVEQVELNSQITNLRLMLQGALSDQYLTRNTQAVATRAQTTMGFSVSLDPPRQYKRAVAEVRVIVVSPVRAGEVSIVNILPAAKTYNVAKVTSRQSAYGAGVIVDAISVGATTGKAKDRLYLAKDTDTVALEYPDERTASMSRPFPQFVADLGKEIERWLALGDCSNDVPELPGQNVRVFGWQFRPVLGADYVQAGQRQVFAQLALPTTITQAYAPYVYIQTRWLNYNENKQAVGAAFTGSCTTVRLTDPITMQAPVQVDDIRTTDIGGGILQFHVTGRFFSPGISALAGSTAIPVFTSDGRSLDLFVNAGTLMQSGTINLMQEDGTIIPLGIGMTDLAGKDCQIANATVVPVPLPDGTSRVSVDIKYGSDYKPDSDGAPDPIVLIGNQIFGLQSAPFLRRENQTDFCAAEHGRIACHFDLIAPTDALRSAETFVVRDLRWNTFARTGNLEFEPSFASIKSLVPPPKDKDKAKQKTPAGTTYSITGAQLTHFSHGLCTGAAPTIDDNGNNLNCVELFDGNIPIPFDKKKTNITFDSPTTALLVTETPLKTTAVRVLWFGHSKDAVEWDLVLPKPQGESIVATPALLNVGDSRLVTFSGGEDLAAATGPAEPALKFDGGNGTVILAGTFDKDKGTLKVLIPTIITQRAGYKEITAMLTVPTQKNPKAVQLPIQVVQGATTFVAN